jgi:hypothetical protein
MLELRNSGMGSILFWQLGDRVQRSAQLAHDAGFAVYYGSKDRKYLVDGHIQAFERKKHSKGWGPFSNIFSKNIYRLPHFGASLCIFSG